MSTKKRRKFSPQEKIGAVRQVLSKAKTASEICRELTIHPNVYYRWQNDFLEGARERFESTKRGRKSTRQAKMIEKYEHEIQRLNSVITEVVKENVELKKKEWNLMKGGHCSEEHKKEILTDMEITQKRTGWGKMKLCLLYGVTKSTVHRWEKESKHPPEKRVGRNPYEILDEEVRKVIEYRTSSDERRRISHKKLTYMMIDEDIVYLSVSSVYRILKKHRLLGPSYKEKGDAGDEYAEKPAYVHHHWHVDIAYVKIYGEFFYLVAMLDGYSRFVLGWKLMLDMTKQSVTLFAQKVCDEYPEATPKIIHDNGSQFVSHEFKNLLRENGCFDIATRVRHPETNGKIERFFGLVRQEALGPNSPVTLFSAEKVIEEYVRYYNNTRLHSSIGYVAPIEVFKGTHEEIFTKREQKRAEAKKKRIEINRMRRLNTAEALPA
ncbi:MAG: IS3 family transposase [Clostridia bacterium]|nr:IS3 family transposase [Clostridia bacterium]